MSGEPDAGCNDAADFAILFARWLGNLMSAMMSEGQLSPATAAKVMAGEERFVQSLLIDGQLVSAVRASLLHCEIDRALGNNPALAAEIAKQAAHARKPADLKSPREILEMSGEETFEEVMRLRAKYAARS